MAGIQRADWRWTFIFSRMASGEMCHRRFDRPLPVGCRLASSGWLARLFASGPAPV
jgi:hypothetical protein